MAFVGCHGFRFLLAARASKRAATSSPAGFRLVLAIIKWPGAISLRPSKQTPITSITPISPRGSIQSYLGRADHETQRYASARRLLQQAIVINKNDNVARLYLGLTLAQMGDRENGLKQIQAGLKGIYDWIVYVRQNFSAGNEYGQFWDQNGTIRAAIQVDLNMIASNQIDWPKLLADGASIGKQMDNEINVAQTDQRIIVTEAISGR
jgi:tetratricopeptide (TPR) repeat protein